MSMDLDFNSNVIEQLILKKALTDKKYLGILSNISDIRWFKNKNIGVLLDLSTRYFKKYNEVPSVKVLQLMTKRVVDKQHHIEGKRSYENYHPDIDLPEINNELVTTSAMELHLPEDAINNNVTEYLKERALYYTFSDNMEYMEKTKSVDKCLAVFERFQKLSFADTNLGLDYFNEEHMKKHWDYILNPEAKVKTNWGMLDKYTNGGFLKEGKDLVCFMGQAGLGKSLFLSNLAVNFLKQNLSVVVISLEMSENVYAKRFDAHISQDNINRLHETHEDSIRKIKEFYAQFPEASLMLKEYPPRSVKTSDIEAYLENLKTAGRKIDVIIIDYLNLVLSNSKSDTMYESVLDVAEKLRAISYKYCAPVITATQATTDGMDNENIGMEHVSESRGICHTVDELFALFQTPADRNEGIIQVRILKNRAGGEVGKTFNMKLDPQNLTLRDDTSVGRDAAIESESGQILNNLDDMDEEFSRL